VSRAFKDGADDLSGGSVRLDITAQWSQVGHRAGQGGG
jgi:hypothetical protein